jgi:hypothetical protein
VSYFIETGSDVVVVERRSRGLAASGQRERG